MRQQPLAAYCCRRGSCWHALAKVGDGKRCKPAPRGGRMGRHILATRRATRGPGSFLRSYTVSVARSHTVRCDRCGLCGHKRLCNNYKRGTVIRHIHSTAVPLPPARPPPRTAPAPGSHATRTSTHETHNRSHALMFFSTNCRSVTRRYVTTSALTYGRHCVIILKRVPHNTHTHTL